MSDCLMRVAPKYREGYIGAFEAPNKAGKMVNFSVQVRKNQKFSNKELAEKLTKVLTDLGAQVAPDQYGDVWQKALFPTRELDNHIAPEVCNIESNLFSFDKMRKAVAKHFGKEFCADISGKIDTHVYSIWHCPGANHIGEILSERFRLLNVKKAMKRLSSLHGSPTHRFENAKVTVKTGPLWDKTDGDMILTVPGLDQPFFAQLRLYDKVHGMIKGLAMVIPGDELEILTGVNNVKAGFVYLGAVNKGFLMTHILGTEEDQKRGVNNSNRRAQIGPAMVNGVDLSYEDLLPFLKATAYAEARNFANAADSGRLLEYLYGERSPETGLNRDHPKALERNSRDEIFVIFKRLGIPITCCESLVLAMSKTFRSWKDSLIRGYSPETGTWSKSTPGRSMKRFGIDLPESGNQIGYSLWLFIVYYPGAKEVLAKSGVQWDEQKCLPYKESKMGKNYLHAIDTDTLNGVPCRITLFSEEFKEKAFDFLGGPDLDGDAYAKCKAGKTICFVDYGDGKLKLSKKEKAAVMFFRFPVGAGEYAYICMFNTQLKYNRLKGEAGKVPLLPPMKTKEFKYVELESEPKDFDGKEWSVQASREISALVETQSVFGTKVNCNSVELLLAEEGHTAVQFKSELFVDTYQQLLGTPQLLAEADGIEEGIRSRLKGSVSRIQNLRYGLVSRKDGELRPDGDDIFSRLMLKKGEVYSARRADLVHQFLSPEGLMINRRNAMRAMAEKNDRIKDAIDFVYENDLIPEEISTQSWNDAKDYLLSKEVIGEFDNVHERFLRYWAFVSEFGYRAVKQNPSWMEEKARTWLNDTKLLGLNSTSSFDFMTTKHPVVQAICYAHGVVAEEALADAINDGEAPYFKEVDDSSYEPPAIILDPGDEQHYEAPADYWEPEEVYIDPGEHVEHEAPDDWEPDYIDESHE